MPNSDVEMLDQSKGACSSWEWGPVMGPATLFRALSMLLNSFCMSRKLNSIRPP